MDKNEKKLNVGADLKSDLPYTIPSIFCSDENVREFVRTDSVGDSTMIESIPRLISVKPLPPQPTERFALRLSYENGECRKYILTIPIADEEKEMLKYENYVFTDKIWASATLKDSREPEIDGYNPRGLVVEFKNDFFLSAIECYARSEDFSEPTICDDVLYEDDKLCIKRIWNWENHAVFSIKDSHFLRAFLEHSDAKGRYSFITPEGKRATTLSFDYYQGFKEDRAAVGKDGRGNGYIDKNLNVVIPLEYDRAEDFFNGYAKVKKDGSTLALDYYGKNLLIGADGKHYERVGGVSEGMCSVSTIPLDEDMINSMYPYDFIMGKWGYTDLDGNEIIPPQYLRAFDFHNGRAIVCKTDWIKEYDGDINECISDKELWGVIDKKGYEVIPFIFDDIHILDATGELYEAHSGGWDDGKWGIIDKQGNWILDPVLEEIIDTYNDGLIVFGDGSRDEYEQEKYGVYDIYNKKVIVKPEYRQIYFSDKGNIIAMSKDVELHRTDVVMFDREGKPLIGADYNYVYPIDENEEFYEAGYYADRFNRESGGNGIARKDGFFIVPCRYSFGEICTEKKLFTYFENKKCGVMDFEQNVIIPPTFGAIKHIDEDIYFIGDNPVCGNENLITPDGKTLLPKNYKKLLKTNNKNRIIGFNGTGCEMIEIIRKQATLKGGQYEAL